MRSVAAITFLLSACSGLIPAGERNNDPDDPAFCESAQPGASPLRRLTRFEYDNTIRDLLGDDSRPASSFPAENETRGFDNQASGLTVPPVLAEQYLAAAESIAERAVADLGALLPCDPAGDESGCADQFIERFGRRAYRRPLTDEDRDRLRAVYEVGASDGGFAAGVRLVIEVALQSPHFLYRVELGGDGGAIVAVEPYEMASRLSYFLWGTMPDDALFAEADRGALADPAAVRAAAERMIDDPRARPVMERFTSQWLRLDEIDGLTKSEEQFPEFYPELRDLMRREAQAMLDEIIGSGGDLRQLFTASHSYMNAELAAFYGVSGPSGEAFERVELDPAERVGILTMAGVLSTHAKTDQGSPIHRGKFVREQLLCNEMPSPPPGLDVSPPALDPGLTTRERFSQHSDDPSCKGCHQLIDPIGFGFERYDGIGRYRDDENGLPIDVSGELVQTDVDGPFDGVRQLGERLAASDQVARCIATQVFRFGFGREREETDACTGGSLDAALVDSGYDLRAVFVALTQTDAFLYRSVE